MIFIHKIYWDLFPADKVNCTIEGAWGVSEFQPMLSLDV